MLWDGAGHDVDCLNDDYGFLRSTHPAGYEEGRRRDAMTEIYFTWWWLTGFGVIFLYGVILSFFGALAVLKDLEYADTEDNGD